MPTRTTPAGRGSTAPVTTDPVTTDPVTTDPGTTDPGTTDLGVVDGLVQLSFLVQSVLGRVAAAHDLSIIQTRLLGVLRDREIGMLELSRILDLEKSSVTGLVDRAERRGLVRRVAVVDNRRAVRVILTPEGQAIVGTASEEVAASIAHLVAGLDSVEQKRLAHLTTTLVLADAASRAVAL